MAYQMWKKGRNSNDYNFFDRTIGEQYRMGGTDMWLYTYQGPKGNEGSTDETLPDYSDGSGTLSDLGDYVLGETVNRSYNIQAITLPVVYQVQEATPDLKVNGILYFNFDTMDITMHYNTMMQRVGRKIISGDVIELPNLRDFDVLDRDVGINKFYVVQDAFRSSEGYSATWQHHIYKIRVKPLTDSPEFSDITDAINEGYPDNPDDPNNGNGNSGGGGSTGDFELDIMNRIIQQADSEVPYIHYTNEHIYDDMKDINELARYIISGYEFPTNPSKNMFFIKNTLPVLYEKDTDSNWTVVQTKYGAKFPTRAKDYAFFFKEDQASVAGYSLFQYYLSDKKWLSCVLPFTDEDSVPQDAEDFYCFYQKPQIYQVQDDGLTWVIPPESHAGVPFTTKDIAANRYNHDDIRSAIPPARGDVGEGSAFPTTPEDGEYFYRTDYVPVTLWQYSADKATWTQFNYGGRLPWTGANIEQTNYINSPDRVSIQDVVKPNIVNRRKGTN